MIISGVEFTRGAGGQYEAKVGNAYLMVYKGGPSQSLRWSALSLLSGEVLIREDDFRKLHSAASWLVEMVSEELRLKKVKLKPPEAANKEPA